MLKVGLTGTKVDIFIAVWEQRFVEVEGEG